MFLLFWTFKKNPEPSSVATKLKYKILKTEFSIQNARVFVFVKSAKLFFNYDCFFILKHKSVFVWFRKNDDYHQVGWVRGYPS